LIIDEVQDMSEIAVDALLHSLVLGGRTQWIPDGG